MLEVVNVNTGEPLTRHNVTYAVDSDGWDYSRHEFCIRTESGRSYDGTYRAGLLVKHASDAELRQDVLRSVARDIDTATSAGVYEPTVRDMIVHLTEEFGYENPVSVYDTAVQLVELVAWNEYLSDEEMAELEDLVRED